MPRLVAPSRQQALEGDILVQFFPMQAAPRRADADAGALLGAGGNEAWKPCEQRANRAPVGEIDS